MESKIMYIKKLAKLRVLVKMFSKEIENIESELFLSLPKNPVPNVTIKITDGQVRPKWKEEFISLANRSGYDADILVKNVQDNTERGKSSSSIVIGNDYEPDIAELIPILTNL